MKRAGRLLAICSSIGVLLVVALVSLAAMARTVTDAWGCAYVLADVERLPSVDTALVLGTALFGLRGQNQRTLAWRLDTAAALWHGGAVDHVIVSGIRIGEDYDEAGIMRDELVVRGVPATAIALDQRGDRTWDSISRARHVFGMRRLLIVSQADHLARALFLARHAGIEAWGVPARGVEDGSLSAMLFANMVSLVAYLDVLRGPSAQAIAAGLRR